MDVIYLAVRYLLDRVIHRLRVALGGDPESGALTLEWIVIAVALALAAGVAVLAFKNSIAKQLSQLP
jgi:hypothetical protein